MDFGWSAEQVRLYDEARRFAADHLVLPGGRRAPADWRRAWDAIGGFGAAGLCIPERHGGSGADALTTARVYEGLGEGGDDVGLLFSAAAHLFACAMPIVDHGDEALKERFLPGLAAGRLVGANAATESEAGSDIFAMTTRAVKDGDCYVLSGSKSFVTNGPVADVFLVYASTSPEDGYLGVSAFLVERGAPGLTIGEPFAKVGLETSPIGSIYLDECRVPESNRLGPEGCGGGIFRSSMAWERACLFGIYLGAMERQLGQAVRYAKDRRQFGRPIGKNQAVSHRIVDMKLRLDAAKLLLYRACWCFDQGRSADLEISLAKLATAEAAVQNGLDLIRIHGGSGVISETGVDRALRDALPATLFSGSSEIQRNLVASKLGL